MIPSDVVVIGESPSIAEDTVGEAFIGPAYDLFDSMLSSAGIEPLTISYTHLVACSPDEDRKPTKTEQMQCFPRLVEFIRITEPSLVICLGDVVAKTVKDWIVGQVKIRDSYEPIYHYMVHPNYILRTGGKESLSYTYGIVELRGTFGFLKKLKGLM